MRAVRAVAAIAAVAVIATGCSNTARGVHVPQGPTASSPGTRSGTAPVAASGGCQLDVVAQICATVAITGAISLTGSGRAPAPIPDSASPKVTCAQLATLNDGGSKDLGDSIQGVDGHEVMWDASFGGFHGPGQYGLADVQFYLTVDTVAYYPATGSSLSITVGPDFATKLTFAQLKSSDGAGAVSGNLSWTCKDPT